MLASLIASASLQNLYRLLRFFKPLLRFDANPHKADKDFISVLENLTVV